MQCSSPSHHHLPLLVEPLLPLDESRYLNDCSATSTAAMKPPKPLPGAPGSALAGRQNPGAIGPTDLSQQVVQPGPLSPGAAPQTMPGALQDAPVTPPQAISKGRPLDSPETPAGARMSKRQASQGEDSPGATVGSGTPLLSLGRLGPPIWLGSESGPSCYA